MNSQLGDWYIRQLGVTRNGGYFEYKPMFVEQLPVPVLPQAKLSKFEADIANAANNDAINGLVFNLYHLTEEEKNYMLNA